MRSNMIEFENGDDASVFETAADLFAVLAIAAIVAVVFYGSSIRTLGTSQDALVEPRTGVGAAALSDTLLLIVTSMSGPSRVELRYHTRPVETIPLNLQEGSRASTLAAVMDAVQTAFEGHTPELFYCLIDESASDAMDGVYVAVLAELTKAGYDCGVGFLE